MSRLWQQRLAEYSAGTTKILSIIGTSAADITTRFGSGWSAARHACRDLTEMLASKGVTLSPDLQARLYAGSSTLSAAQLAAALERLPAFAED